MIEDVIQEIFSDLNIPVIFIHKPDGYVVDDYITYNFTIDEEKTAALTGRCFPPAARAWRQKRARGQPRAGSGQGRPRF